MEKMRRLRGSHKRMIVLVVLPIILMACLLLAAAFGAVSLSPLDIVKMVLDKMPFVSFPSGWDHSDEIILFQIRLPRVVGGMLVGAALATAGVLFQGLLRNPMADPYIIGTSAGAAFAATLVMSLSLNVLFMGFGLVPLAAFLGALSAVLVVYSLARTGGRTPVVSMLLAGFAVSSLLAAAMSFLMIVGERLQPKIYVVLSFLMGGIAVTGWEEIRVIAPLIVLGIVVAWLFASSLNAFSLGEEGAAYVGVEVEREKLLILALGSLLTAAAVSISGLVGFVGLVMPHAMRLVLGPEHRFLLPAAAVAGGAFLVGADLLARTIRAPQEIPVGVITALIGAPFFLYLLRRSRREYAL